MWVSWNDFRAKQKYDRLPYSIVEEGGGIGFEEGFDYGMISIAERLREEAAADDLELLLRQITSVYKIWSASSRRFHLFNRVGLRAIRFRFIHLRRQAAQII